MPPQWPSTEALDVLWAELSEFVASDGLVVLAEGDIGEIPYDAI